MQVHRHLWTSHKPAAAMMTPLPSVVAGGRLLGLLGLLVLVSLRDG
jgi:hypothetical protein